MPTVLLVRHGLTALTGTTLVGWTPGVSLDDRGRAQAEAVARRLLGLGLRLVVSSPVERCRETAAAVVAGREPAPPLELDDRFGETHYGDWTGRTFKELRRESLWKAIRDDPPAARFPNGEALHEVGARAVAGVRAWNERLGPDATYVIVSHADPIRAILVDALGMAFAAFARLSVSPGSLSVVRYGSGAPVVLRVNDTGLDPTDLLQPSRRTRGLSRRSRAPAQQPAASRDRSSEMS